jgi:hypothetical protein
MDYASELIAAARNKIARPELWTRGRMMRDRNGAPVHYLEGGAVVFSAAGAVLAITIGEKTGDRRWADALTYLNAACPPPSTNTNPLWAYENRPETTHADMLAVFDRAYAAAKAAEQTGMGQAA